MLDLIVCTLALLPVFNNLQKQLKMKDSKSIIAAMLKDGCKKVESVVVKNATARVVESKSTGNEYIRVVLTLNQEIPQYTLNRNNLEYEQSTSRIVVVTGPSVAHHLSENEETAFVRNIVMKDLKLLEMVLSYSRVDLLLEPVKDKQQYTNPFSENPEPHELSHDNIFVHLIGLEMGKLALKRIDRIIDKVIDRSLDGEPIELNRVTTTASLAPASAASEEVDDDDEAAAS